MIKDWTAIRERFMKDPLPVRLGGLAANLSRIKSFSANENSRETVASLIDESKIQYKEGEGNATAADVAAIQAQLNGLFTKAKDGKSITKDSLKIAKDIKQKFKK